MLLGILKLYFETGTQLGHNTFDIIEMYKLDLSGTTQFWIFLAFFVAFAIKVPMFPFHTWLPDAHVEAPTAGSVILAAVLLKMGTYGFVRFSLPILPKATLELLPWMLILCVVGIIYGAMVAMAQKDVKKLVAYSSVSHLGFCMLGIFALNPPGLSGGILQMINHGLSTGALFLLVGIIYERRHTRMIADFGGLSKSMPVFAVFFMVILLSSIGLPGLNGFIGEFTILLGAFHIDLFEASNKVAFFFKNQIWATLAVTGIILGAAYMLWLYQRVFFGKLDKPENEKLEDVKVFGREGWTLIPIVILCLWIGLYPKPFFRVLEEPVKKLVERIQPDYFDKWDEAKDADFGVGDKMPPVPKGHGSDSKDHGGGH
jgi:NADH-quinone oxidoreductase subunit M